ncbi:MAG: hypothetical protein IJV40_06790 [Oscillospiraceae bacterium]|nr:hypothetical protein [Oscillospiraceae bacterium]
MKKKLGLDSIEYVLLTICTILLMMILFVLFGGARILYSRLTSGPEAQMNAAAIAFARSHEHGKSIPADLKYIPPSPFARVDDLLGEILLSEIYAYQTDSGQSHMQGACTDGTSLWFGWDNPHMIMKIQLLTGEVTSVSYDERAWIFGHINDMTYNPNTDELVICSYVSEKPATYGNLAVLDADTLNCKQRITVRKDGKMLPFFGIAFDRLHNHYILAGAENSYHFLDSGFQWLNTIYVKRYESDTRQGLETDGSYIFHSLWHNFESNLISVYDMKGNFVRFVDVPLSGYETELQDIMYDWHGNWYINTADYDREKNLAGCSLYQAYMQSSVDLDQVQKFQALLQKFLLSADA